MVIRILLLLLWSRTKHKSIRICHWKPHSDLNIGWSNVYVGYGPDLVMAVRITLPLCPIRLELGGQAGYGQCFFGEGWMAVYGEGYVGGVGDWIVLQSCGWFFFSINSCCQQRSAWQTDRQTVRETDYQEEKENSVDSRTERKRMTEEGRTSCM